MSRVDPPPRHLPLHDLGERHRGLTPAIAACYAEAARVCLDRHHNSPTTVSIQDSADPMQVAAVWERTDERTRGAWANETDATEAGAYACVLAALELARQLVAVRRAETLTGADYYVAPPGEGSEDLESCLRLEVSGVDSGSESVVHQRLRAKVKQARAGASNLPAIAGVVGFESLVVVLETVASE